MIEAPTEPGPNETAPPAEKEAAAAPAATRRYPLRFVWQIDAAGRFTIGSDEFITLIGPQTAAALGRPWDEVAATLGLDPEGHLARALATHETWSGLLVAWPVDDSDERLTVELSGLPVFDRDRSFRGYRGFGVCRDLARLAALAQSRLGVATEPPATEAEEPSVGPSPTENVVPLPASSPPEVKAPSLSPVERHAFHELARRLTERLSGTDTRTSLRALLTPPANGRSPGDRSGPPNLAAKSGTRPGPRRRTPRPKGSRGAIRLSRPGQPRDPHAAQHHHRLLRGDDGGALRPRRQRPLPAISQ